MSWSRVVADEIATELSTDERDFFSGQTPIDIMEQIDFHFALENLSDLKSLEAAIAPARKTRPKAVPPVEDPEPKTE